MAYLIYLIILIVCCFLITRLSFFKESEIRIDYLIVFFLIRAVAGLFVSYMSYHFGRFPDSLLFHNNSIVESHWLIYNPSYFLNETFSNYGEGFRGIFITHSSFWNNLKSNLIIKPLAVLNLVTLRNFYTNTLVFNFFVFTGSVALFRVLSHKLSLKKPLLMVMVFLYPTGLLFTATIHREGLIWLCFSLFLLALTRMSDDGFTWKRFIVLVSGFILIFCFRNYVAFLMIPALSGWLLSLKYRSKTVVIFACIGVLSIIFLFGARIFFPFADFPQFIVNRASEFRLISEGSSTYLEMNPLIPDFAGFASNFPVAFFHAFLLPGIQSITKWTMLPFALEIVCAEVMILIIAIKGKIKISPFTAFLVFLCFSVILIIGFIVPNLGAIIRYRSIYLHLILILLLSGLFSSSKGKDTYNT